MGPTKTNTYVIALRDYSDVAMCLSVSPSLSDCQVSTARRIYTHRFTLTLTTDRHGGEGHLNAKPRFLSELLYSIVVASSYETSLFCRLE